MGGEEKRTLADESQREVTEERQTAALTLTCCPGKGAQALSRESFSLGRSRTSSFSPLAPITALFSVPSPSSFTLGGRNIEVTSGWGCGDMSSRGG